MGIRRWVAMGAAGVALLSLYLKRRKPKDRNLVGQTVVVTGASRGLGLILARELLREGCRVVICARDKAELERAQTELSKEGGRVLAVPCDVSDQVQVERLIATTVDHFGPVDILINNAGVISVAPIQDMTIADFELAQDVMFWGVLYPTMAVLPQMLERQRGRIVNITSIGGKVSVPHLLPYNTAKFAAVGFSEGLRAELASHGITVTTIVPGLMRTGSYLHALFGGQQKKEFTWFALGATLPFISMDAEKAARQIIEAAREGEAVRILSLPAQILARFHGLFPGFTVQILSLVSGLILPAPSLGKSARVPGFVVEQKLSGSREALLERLTTLGQQAAESFQQYSKGNRFFSDS
jgi:NAD(P)-dependent dehydrogenase (short-subunit alcohol dehydrogenase family)